MTERVQLRLDRAAQHLEVPPGGEIVLRGQLVCSTDASVIDAATTTWPSGAPGGASVDHGGLVDLEQGGFHVTARDPATHEVHAVATGDPAPACARTGVQSPCLPLRLLPLAQGRLQTVGELGACLKGGITVELQDGALPPVAPRTAIALQGAAIAAGIGLLGAAAWAIRRRRALSPAGQMRARLDRVRGKLKAADPVVSAPLGRAFAAAVEAIQRRRVDPASAEGRRVAEALRRVELRLDASAERARAEEEQQAADALLRDLESALEAAEEVAGAEARIGATRLRP